MTYMDEDEEVGELERVYALAKRFALFLLMDYDDADGNELVMRRVQERVAELPPEDREPFLIFALSTGSLLSRGFLRDMDGFRPMAETPPGREALDAYADMFMKE